MSKKNVLEEFDASKEEVVLDEAVKSEDKAVESTPVVEEEAPATEEAATAVEEEAPAVEEAPAAEPEAAKDVAEDAPTNPKPFEKDGQVQESPKADTVNGNEKFTALEEAFRGGLADVAKSMASNQEAISGLADTMQGIMDQLNEVKSMLIPATATSTSAEKSEDADEAVKADDKEEEAKDQKHPEDCDCDDCKAARAKKSDDDSEDAEKSDDQDADDKDAEKSLEADDVAEVVEDEPLYVEKSAAAGSVVEYLTKEAADDKDAEPEAKTKAPEDAVKSLQERFITDNQNLYKFNDKLIAEASAGLISGSDYAEKQLLSQDIAYGRAITAEKLDDFEAYIK